MSSTTLAVRIDVTHDPFLYGPRKSWDAIYTLESLPKHYVCENPLCRMGGWSSDQVLADVRELVATRGGVKESMVKCPGHENMGRGQSRICKGGMLYDISVGA
jgi:hypothetical protein